MDMASTQQVKNYLAYWFLLGKKVILPRQQDAVCPSLVFEGETYSPEFERFWQKVSSPAHQEAYLEGTSQTIAQLLSSQWEIVDCAKCQMPIPMVTMGIQSSDCPCCDLDTWPNSELPKPRFPVNSQNQINRIRERLNRCQHHEN